MAHVTNAVRSYQRLCRRRGWVFQQPSLVLSSETRHRVVLRNARGILATYAIEGRSLRLVDAGEPVCRR